MKTVLITGIGKGIGKALAQKFLNDGYFVIGTSVSGEIDFTSELGISSQNIKVFQLDLLDSKSIEACAKSIEDFGKKLDIHINNAGALFDEDETSVNVDKLRKTLEVNLIGPSDLTERLIPIINDNGHLVFISSSAGSLAEVATESHYFGHYPAYKISKCAINMYMRTLAMRLKNIKVSSIHPGWTRTEMGGEDAPMTPEEAALHIFETATNKDIETGQFWFKGEKFPW